MSVMLGMPTLMPRGFARSRPQTKQQNRGSSHVSDSSSRPGPCRPPLLALLCNSRGWPAAPQREAFIFGHKAHQIQLFWKGWAVFPAPKGYSHALNPAVILLPPVFSLWCLFLSFGGGRSLTCRPLVERHVTPCFFLSLSSCMNGRYVCPPLTPAPPRDAEVPAGAPGASRASSWMPTLHFCLIYLVPPEPPVTFYRAGLSGSRPAGCVCFGILWRVQPKQDMPHSTD